MFVFLITRLRTAFWTFFYRSIGRSAFKRIGQGCVFEGWIDLPQRAGRIELGDNVRISRLVEFTVPRGGALKIGSGVFISRGVLVSAHKEIRIGEDTMLAEFVAIHDNNHGFSDRKKSIKLQPMTARPVRLERDVWIGANSVILAGSTVPEGCVVGAMSLVSKSCNLTPFSVAFGQPVKIIRDRSL
nr:acyltransferase [uncultured Celeribacter sp.]